GATIDALAPAAKHAYRRGNDTAAMSEQPPQQGTSEARATRTTMRILVANEPRSYREAIAGAVQVLRPHLAVITVEPEDLDEEVMCHNPGLVLCSRRSRVVESWP